MGFLSVLTQAQRWVAERVEPGSIVIDATAGGGVDTLFLARAAGSQGHVYAFDVQASALARTRTRLEAAQDGKDNSRLAPVTLLHSGHEHMRELLPPEAMGHVHAAMFNLGYLPGGDVQPDSGGLIITQPETTLLALDSAFTLLAPGGILTIVVYPGHAGGLAEAEAVDHWTAHLSAEAAQVVQYRYPQKPASAYLVAIEKNKKE